MFLKRKTILILLIFIFSIGAVSASENSTDIQSVDENVELTVSNDDVLAANEVGTFTELQKKITALVDDEDNENYTIVLDKDYSYTEGDSKDGISLVDMYDLTIDGNGKTLDGKSTARIFYINYGSVTLKNIILKNGNAKDGGAIKVDGADLIIVNSSFIKNNAPKYYNGGALFIFESNVNITKSTFDSNTAYFSGGAICFESGKLIIDNAKFNNNSAGDCGGAISQDLDSIVVKNSIFNSNTANKSGGAISAFNFKFENNTLINNNLPELKIIFKKFVTQYKSGKVFNVTVVDKFTGQPVTNAKVSLRMIHSIDEKHPSSKTIHATTDSNGVASFKTISNLRPGYYDWGYDFEIDGSYGDYMFDGYEIAVNKWPTIVKAPKVTFKAKKSKYFKVTVKDKKTNKALKNIKIKVKVFTGKKYKTYNIKTNKKGVAKLNTKTITKGTHKVKISSTDKYYKVSAKSTIKIK